MGGLERKKGKKTWGLWSRGTSKGMLESDLEELGFHAL